MTVKFITVFDLDHTLVKVNSSACFGKFLYKAKVLSFSKMVYLLFLYYSHKIGFISITRLHQLVSHHFFYGHPLKEIQEQVRDFLDKNLDAFLNTDVVKCMQKAQQEGHYAVILSSSPEFLVGEIAKRLKANEWAGVKYDILPDQTFGKPCSTMEGSDKAKYVAHLKERFDVAKENITGYTDSHLDLPFLETVGTPIAINPDPTLRKICKKKHWTIVDIK